MRWRREAWNSDVLTRGAEAQRNFFRKKNCSASSRLCVKASILIAEFPLCWRHREFENRGFATLIQVFDMPTSLAFYRDVLGFDVISDAPADGQCDWAWLKRGESELMLNTAYEAEDRPPAPDPARVRAHADTALFFGCERCRCSLRSTSCASDRRQRARRHELRHETGVSAGPGRLRDLPSTTGLIPIQYDPDSHGRPGKRTNQWQVTLTTRRCRGRGCQ